MTEPTELQPIPGSWWTHRNGALYTVLMIANSDTEDEARYPVTVVYQGDNGKVWSRPASDWHRSMTATTPQPTQTQAGAVPLTDEQIRVMAREHPAEDLCGWSYRMGVADAERHYGIKGGQHGAE